MSALRDFVQQLRNKITGKSGAGPASDPVLATVLQSITISPASATLIDGWQRQFKAIGKFSDKTTGDLTSMVGWKSSAETVVSITAKGVATAKPVSGVATITATDPTTHVAGSTTATTAPNPMPTRSPTDDVKAEVFAGMEEALRKSPPDKKALKDLVDGGGSKILDLVVKNMPDPPDRETITVAMEARFNITMKDTDADDDTDGAEGNKSMKQIYLTMLKVPDGAVRNNPSLKEIDREPGVDAENPKGKTFAYYQNKKAVFPALRADLEMNPLGVTTELPEVEDAYKPKETKEKTTFLAWNTLHEVAHGVDDNKSVMADSGGKGNAYAGWETYASVDKVAEKVSTAKSWNKAYLLSLLGAADPATVAAPKEVTEDQKKEAVAWAKAVRTGNKLWKKGDQCSKFAIGGRVYQEAYPNEWVSYNLDARKKGITGYQFRAPGEWFAELYAAYYSGKLKDNHPYAEWLRKW